MPCQRKVCNFKSTETTLNFGCSSSSGLHLYSHLAERTCMPNRHRFSFLRFPRKLFRYLRHVSCLLIFIPNHSQPSKNIRLFGSHNFLWKRCSPSSQSNRLSTFPFLRRLLQDWSGQCLVKLSSNTQEMTNCIHDRRRLEMKSCFRRTTLSSSS